MSTPSSLRSGLTIGRATDDDWPDIITADARAFAMRNPLPPDEAADLRSKVRNSDVVLVRDTNRSPAPLAGVSMFYRMPLTMPGREPVDVAGLSWVSVASTHRRRGILRTMITEMFDQWEADGLPFAILTASEGTIYGRFGFGPASFAQSVTIPLDRARMRQPAPDICPVHFADADEIARRVPELHARWARQRPGAIGRGDTWWRPILADRESERPPVASGLHYLLHDDGYASYRVFKDMENGSVRAVVEEVVPITEEAHTELWRVLTSLDLIPSLSASIPVDDPLPEKLTDLRAAEVTGRDDKMWLRILDVPAAFGARAFSADLDAVIEVTDEFRSRGGVFDVSIRNGGAAVIPSTAAPTVRMDISVLSSIFLGGVAPSRFAAAGRLWTSSPEVLRDLDRAFGTDVAPYSGTFF